MKTATDRIQQKIEDGTQCLSPSQDYLTAVHEAGHVVGYWAISRKILAKLQRSRERFQRTGLGRIIRRLPDLPPKFKVVLRTPDEVEAGPYHRRDGSKIDCCGIVDMDELDLDARLELSAGERVKFHVVGLLAGSVAETYAASLDTHHSDDWLLAQANQEREWAGAWEIVRRQYGGKHIGEDRMYKLADEARDLLDNHWAAIEALAVKLVERRVIKSEEAIAIIEAGD